MHCPTPARSSPERPSRTLTLIGCGLLGLAQLLAGCAADAWKPNPNISPFLNQVERVCGTTRIGELTVSQLMNPASAMQSAYFVDMTSRFDQGKVSAEAYALGISSTFNTVRDSAGIRCIIEQKNP